MHLSCSVISLHCYDPRIGLEHIEICMLTKAYRPFQYKGLCFVKHERSEVLITGLLLNKAIEHVYVCMPTQAYYE